MQINPYLSFDRDCEAAMNFYCDVLGGTVVNKMRMGEMPGDDQSGLPEDRRDLMANMIIQVAGQVIMGSDSFGKPVSHDGFSLQVAVDDPDEGKRIFEALTKGGEVRMAYDKTFWARGFGVGSDRFGVSWMVNCDCPRRGSVAFRPPI